MSVIESSFCPTPASADAFVIRPTRPERPVSLSVLSRPTALAALALAAILSVSGCDFSRVDAGVDVSTADHVAALAAATTASDAERAIRGVFNKVGVRTAWQADVPDEDLAFGSFYASDDQIAALAEEHAQFVTSQREGTTLRDAHAAVLRADDEANRILASLEVGVTRDDRGTISVRPAEAAAILESAAVAAQRSPESPTSAMALVITANGPALPTASGRVDASREMSPVQRFLYSVWLHQTGPFMYPFLSDPAPSAGSRALLVAGPSCDAGQSCDACCDGEGKFTAITLQYLGPAATVQARVSKPPPKAFTPFPATPLATNQLFTVDATTRPPTSGGLSGTIGNELTVTANGVDLPNIHTSCSVPVTPGMVFQTTSAGVTYGVRVIAVTTKKGGKCSNLEVCTGACRAQLLSCELTAAGDPDALQACADTFRSCDLNCHDQGGIF